MLINKCTDCRYIHIKHISLATCYHPFNISPVNGDMREIPCESMRACMGKCGEEGRLFEKSLIDYPASPRE